MPKNLLNLFKKDPIPTAPEEAPKKITEKTIIEATKTLNKYKAGKSILEQKIIANEEYWKMRQWDRGVGGAKIENGANEYNVPSTPWLHSCIESRHADAMDSYPTCNVRPRQKDDEAEAKKLEAKIRKNKFDFSDFYNQIQQIKKMGNLKDLASMIPGVGKALKDIDIDDNAFKGIEAIIQSMTPYEREHPECLNTSRRHRIAKGAGVDLQQVNRLIKQFDQTRKMMKMMTDKSKMAQMASMMKGKM